MLEAGFETPIPSSERPQTHTLERSATEIGLYLFSPFFLTFYLISISHHLSEWSVIIHEKLTVADLFDKFLFSSCKSEVR
jgi:hypothetical protein